MQFDMNLSRLFKFIKLTNSVSITRALQIELIAQIDTKGEVFDFGGGDLSSYRKLLNCSKYESANIDENMKPTWLTIPGQRIPIENDKYQTAISFNTLEHIYNSNFVVEELYRILQKNGQIHILTPFLFPVHGHPDDFFRPTKSWYEKTLSSSGFVDIEVTPLFWGPFSTAFSCSGSPGPFKKSRRVVNILLDFFYWKLRLLSRKSRLLSDTLSNFPLSYYVYAKKM